MSRISPTGKGLNIVISCEYTPLHDWMTFASWYSIYKNLPDAEVGVFCKRTNIVGNLFEWKSKTKIPFVHYSQEFQAPEGVLLIEPDVMAINTFDPATPEPVDVKIDGAATFVSYLNGCGSFVMSQWINTTRNPFGMASRFYSDNLNLNEYRVLKLWEKCHKIYGVIV